jgi:hypothetical protein
MREAAGKRGWCKRAVGADHAGVSKDTFKGWRKKGLRYVKLESGLELFKFEWIDEFLEEREVGPAHEVAKELLSKL